MLHYLNNITMSKDVNVDINIWRCLWQVTTLRPSGYRCVIATRRLTPLTSQWRASRYQSVSVTVSKASLTAASLWCTRAAASVSCASRARLTRPASRSPRPRHTTTTSSPGKARKVAFLMWCHISIQGAVNAKQFLMAHYSSFIIAFD